MLESKFQAKLIKDLKKRFPGCEILKNDPQYVQGVCDLVIFYNDKWAMLEVKKSRNAKKRPNQDYYVDKFRKMSYAAFIYPENKKEILDEMEQAFSA